MHEVCEFSRHPSRSYAKESVLLSLQKEQKTNFTYQKEVVIICIRTVGTRFFSDYYNLDLHTYVPHRISRARSFAFSINVNVCTNVHSRDRRYRNVHTDY